MCERYISLFSDNRQDYDSRDIRKQTYMFFPSSDISTIFYVDSGFYYTGVDDTSCCFRCGLKINKLHLGQDPFQEHRTLSPDCIFVKERIRNETRHLDESDSNCDSELNFDIDSSGDSEWENTICEETKPIGNLNHHHKFLSFIYFIFI